MVTINFMKRLRFISKSPVGKVKCLVFSTWLNKTIGFAHINPAFAHFGGVLEAFATHNPKNRCNSRFHPGISIIV